jgi:hypothetical protein
MSLMSKDNNRMSLMSMDNNRMSLMPSRIPTTIPSLAIQESCDHL